MTDLLDRLRKRQYPNQSNFTVAAGAAMAFPTMGQSGTYTVGGPDRDVVDAIAEIERMERYRVALEAIRDELDGKVDVEDVPDTHNEVRPNIYMRIDEICREALLGQQ